MPHLFQVMNRILKKQQHKTHSNVLKKLLQSYANTLETDKYRPDSFFLDTSTFLNFCLHSHDVQIQSSVYPATFLGNFRIYSFFLLFYKAQTLPDKCLVCGLDLPPLLRSPHTNKTYRKTYHLITNDESHRTFKYNSYQKNQKRTQKTEIS